MVWSDSFFHAQIAELRAAFDAFDEDADGRLDADELGRALHALGHDVGEDEVRRMIAAVDVDGDRELDFPEFVDLVEPRPLDEDPEADWQEAFAVLDRDGDGFVDPADLIASGELDAAAAARVLALVDVDGDGRLGRAEFLDWLRRDG